MAGVLRFGVIVRPLVKTNVPAAMQICGISGKTLRSLNRDPDRPAPFPYLTKDYTPLAAFFDKTTKRFDENTKVITVEGQVAAGKTKFAKELAEELEMHFIPAPSMEDIYINAYGFDMRKLDDQLPEGVKSFDTRKFNLQPTHRLAGTHQINNLYLRILRYVNCLAHVLSTGQGVVTVKSPYSDYVFLEAMHRCNFISKGVRSAYYDLKKNVIDELMKPHLVIYLDVPVAKTKENIKKRNIDYEVNSKALTDQFLNEIEYGYKQSFLKEISSHAELLVYDWSEGGETEVVVEDIERIDFDNFGHYDPKMQDWRIMTEWEWCEKRMDYTHKVHMIDAQFNVPRFDVPELIMTAEDAEIFEEVVTNAPGEKFLYGYNADMGDSGILTKTRNDLHPK